MFKKDILSLLLTLILAMAIFMPTPVSAGTVNLGAVNPPLAYNREGDTHTVSVTISPAAEGVAVTFIITGANWQQKTGLTDSNGTASITYTGNYSGIDSIFAFIDTNGNGDYDAGEPQSSASATKYWLGNYAMGSGNIKDENGKVQWTFAGNVGFIPATSTGGSIPIGKFNIVDHDNKISYYFDEISSLIFWGDNAFTPTAGNNMFRFRATGTSKKGRSVTEINILVIISDIGLESDKGGQISVYKLGGNQAGASYYWWFGGTIGGKDRFISYFTPSPGPIDGGLIDGGNFQIHDIKLPAAK